MFVIDKENTHTTEVWADETVHSTAIQISVEEISTDSGAVRRTLEIAIVPPALEEFEGDASEIKESVRLGNFRVLEYELKPETYTDTDAGIEYLQVHVIEHNAKKPTAGTGKLLTVECAYDSKREIYNAKVIDAGGDIFQYLWSVPASAYRPKESA